MIRPIRHWNEALEVFSEEVKKRTCRVRKKILLVIQEFQEEIHTYVCVCVHVCVKCINIISYFMYVFTYRCAYIMRSLFAYVCVCVHVPVFT